MTFDQDEQDAVALGALFRGEPLAVSQTGQADEASSPRAAGLSGTKGRDPAEDAQEAGWLQQTETDLMAVIDSKGAARASTFPLLRAAETDTRRRSTRIVAWAAAASVAAGALFAATLPLQSEDPALTFVVKGDGAGQSDSQEVGRVRAPADESRTLAFSDGSTLNLDHGGSVRVRETDEHGAEIVVEKGILKSAVVHREHTSWSVFAGPYEIEVIGTKFSTNWDPATQRLVVLLDEGSVQVLGSDIEEHVSLKPGQRFDAAPGDAWKVTSQQRHVEPQIEAPAPQPIGETTSEALDEPADDAPRAARAMPGNSNPGDWSRMLADGRFGDIMAEAKKLGVSNCYSSCSISRLRSLADAARYSGDIAVARTALTKLRERSPSESARAGYLLGSLSEARGQAASALNWYRGYLGEAPGGALATEAQAGQMRALHALGRRADARRAAEEYLRAHPGGTSAATARQILNKK
jgi:hypothetical protein